jgi:Tol biopolymer transport system component
VTDERELLERAARQFPSDVGIVERVYRRRDRRRRNRRIGTAALALIIAAAAIGGLVRAFSSTGTQPAKNPIVAPHVMITRGSVHGFFLMSLDGERAGTIPNLPRRAADVSISPDGDEIAFSEGPYTGIWTMGIDGTNLQRIDRHSTSPSWSSDGTRIASFGAGTVSTTETDGTSRPRSLGCGTSLGSIIAYPKWSPDGEKILCTRISGSDDAPDGNANAEVVWISPGSDQPRQTTLAGEPGVNAWDGAWSPDGSQIAFSRGDTGTVFDPKAASPSYDIWIMDADGSGQRPLVQSDEGADVGPFWSPDGSKIAYTSVGDTRSTWVVDVSSGDARYVGSGTVFGWSTPTTLIVGGSS